MFAHLVLPQLKKIIVPTQPTHKILFHLTYFLGFIGCNLRGTSKNKISYPPIIQKNLISTFESNIDLEELSEDMGITGPFATGAYKAKDLDSNSHTSQLIVVDAIFVTELVEMDFHKDAKRKAVVLLQKVKNKISLCKTTPDDLDAICFLPIIADFKGFNFEHIFKDEGFSTSENLEFSRSGYFFDVL